MAGIKVTDLPVLGAAAPDDVMYIVDTSTNTSKQIAVEDMFVGFPDLGGGDFTSSVVISNEADCTANCLRALFSRVNNIVTCTYYLDITLDATFTVGTFNVSLPVATNFSNVRDAFGVITPITDPYSKLVSAVTNADTVNNEVGITIELLTAGDTLTFVSNIQYIILP
jgi:hypothetical protein